MNKKIHLFCVLVLIFGTNFQNTTFASTVPSREIALEIGNGSQQLGISQEVEDNPSQGPEALVAINDGLAILDNRNHKIIQIDERGKMVKNLHLPSGVFNDLAVDGIGRFILIDELSRKVFAVDDRISELFGIPKGEGFPMQIDGYQIAGKNLIVSDFGTEKFYIFSLEGKLKKSFSFPLIQSFAISPDNLPAILSVNSEHPDEVSMIYYDLEGNIKKKVPILGKEICQLTHSVRLLGFSRTGLAIAYGWDEKGNGIVFSIDEQGSIN
ncbi:MAG: hypothetical protein HQM08_14280, partial [Candidatus Riflebacteria bacterium]|nr:hypothetical protein [Candidatus Riflebacteria bacterium]